MPIESTIENAFEAQRTGEHWRAREILRSSLYNYGYDHRLLLALADTCIAMSDRMEAGRLLLAFVDDPDDSQRALIDLFVDRHRAAGYRSLLSQLPKSLRPTTLSSSPRYLRTVLQDLDAPEALSDSNSASLDSVSPWLAAISCGIVTLVVVLCFLVGLVVIMDWIFDRSKLLG